MTLNCKVYEVIQNNNTIIIFFQSFNFECVELLYKVSQKSAKYTKRYLAWLIIPTYFRVDLQHFMTAFFHMLILFVIAKSFSSALVLSSGLKSR